MTTLTLSTLDDLLNTLQKQASEDESEKKDDEKKKEDEKKSDESKGKEMPWDKKDSSDKSEDRVKEAQLQGAALADEIMQKVASANLTTQKETSMNTAQFAGQALAQSLLTKLASAGDTNTTNGVYPGAMPNKAQIDNAQMTAEHEAIVAPTPTKDGMGNGGGSINQIFDAVVAKALGQGAVAADQVTQTGTAFAEGAVEQHAVPNGVPSSNDEVEKVAAVTALVNSGFDFDQAVEMVKAAEYELMVEEEGQVKQAAMNDLLDAGVDFALAAALVKEASAAGMARRAGRVASVGAEKAKRAATNFGADVAAGARNLGSDIRMVANPSGFAMAGGVPTRGEAVANLARNRAAQLGAGALGAAGLAGGGYALAREKQAALNGLVDAGMDFDTAAALVEETSQELYGA